jgi:hypothetical protein
MRDRRAAAVPVVATLALTGCGGGERQDADAPGGEFALDVTRATFPSRQTLAEPATLRLDVRNPGPRAVPDLAVVVETAPARPGEAAAAFGTRAGGDGAADASRPVWVLERDPAGGRTAYVNTWAFGRVARGASRSVRFAVTAIRPGRYRVRWRVAPALEGAARLSGGGRTAGAFRVTISDEPVRSRVGPGGGVVRDDGA